MPNLGTEIPSVGREEFRLTLDEMAREGARRVLIEALEADVSDYIEH